MIATVWLMPGAICDRPRADDNRYYVGSVGVGYVVFFTNNASGENPEALLLLSNH